MGLGKSYDMVDKEGFWDVMNLYGVGGGVLEGARSFYKDASASVHVNWELIQEMSLALV